jgi:cytochrome c oxidase subunit 4
MSSHSVEDIKRETRGYLLVFLTLAVLTVVTVAVSTLDVSVPVAVTIALLIATVKGSLVACYFMHLISERRAVYGVLIVTVVFFVVLMALPTWSHVARVLGDW